MNTVLVSENQLIGVVTLHEGLAGGIIALLPEDDHDVVAVVEIGNPNVVSQIETSEANVIVAGISQGLSGRDADAGILILQQDPATTWTLRHNLGRYATPSFFDTSGDLILATWRPIDNNTIIATFGRPTSGSAYID